MEYSNEYYKMKYYKYKAKYEQLKAEGGARLLAAKLAASAVKATSTSVKAASTAVANNNAKQAENKMNKKNLDDEERKKLINDIISKSNGTLTTAAAFKLTSYKKLKEYINGLVLNTKERDELLQRAKICSASSFTDALEEECTKTTKTTNTTDSPSTLANVSTDNKV
jgi:hypothetical protein